MFWVEVRAGAVLDLLDSSDEGACCLLDILFGSKFAKQLQSQPASQPAAKTAGSAGYIHTSAQALVQLKFVSSTTSDGSTFKLNVCVGFCLQPL